MSSPIATQYVSRYLGSNHTVYDGMQDTDASSVAVMSLQDAASLQCYGVPTALDGGGDGELSDYQPLHRVASLSKSTPRSIRLANSISHSVLLQEAVSAIERRPGAQSPQFMCALLGEVGMSLWSSETRTALRGSTSIITVAALAVRHVEVICCDLCSFHEWDAPITGKLLTQCVLSSSVLMKTLLEPCEPNSIDAVLSRLAQSLETSLEKVVEAVTGRGEHPHNTTPFIESAQILSHYLRSVLGLNPIEMDLVVLMRRAEVACDSRDVIGMESCMGMCEHTSTHASIDINRNTIDNIRPYGILALVWLRCWMGRWSCTLGHSPLPPTVHFNILGQMGDCCSEVVSCIHGGKENKHHNNTGVGLMRAASGASRSTMQDAVAAGEASLKAAFAALSSSHITLPVHVAVGLRHHIASLLSIKITAAVASAEEALSAGRISTAATRLHSAQQLIILYEQRGLHVEGEGGGGGRNSVRGRIHSLVSKVVSNYQTATSAWHPFELLTVSLTHAGAALACFDGASDGGGDTSGLIDARLSRCELLVAYCEQQATSEVPLRSIFHDTQIGVDVLTPWGGPIYGCTTVCAGVLGVAPSSSSQMHPSNSQHRGYGSTGAVFLEEALQSDLDWIARRLLSTTLLLQQPSPSSTHTTPQQHGELVPPMTMTPLQRMYCVRFYILNAWYHLCVNDDPVAACDPHLLRAVQLVTDNADDDGGARNPLFWLAMRYVEATIRKLDQFALLDTTVNAPSPAASLHTLARTSSSGLHLVSVFAKEYPSSETATISRNGGSSEAATSTLMDDIMARRPTPTTTTSEDQLLQQGGSSGVGGIQDQTLLPAMSFLPCKLQSYRELWWK